MPTGHIQGGKLVLNYSLYGDLLGDCETSAIVSPSAFIAGQFTARVGTATLHGPILMDSVPISVSFDLPSSIDPSKAIGGSVGLDLTTYCNSPATSDGLPSFGAGFLYIVNFEVLDMSGAQIPGYTMTSNGGTNIPELAPPPAVDPRQKVATEFYNLGLEHYFLTASDNDKNALDSGVFAGWIRTGFEFNVVSPAVAVAGAKSFSYALSPVCRYYIPPQHGDSHFFSASPADCALIAQLTQTNPSFSGYVLEYADAFEVAVPDPVTGACPATTDPVYRLWNKRFDSNHRYTTDPYTAEDMVAKGYASEGVVMCAPQ